MSKSSMPKSKIPPTQSSSRSAVCTKMVTALCLLLFCLLCLTVFERSPSLWLTLKLFLMGLSIDLMYVLYLKAVHQKKKIRASLLSVGVAMPALMGTIAVYDDRWLLFPDMLGLFSGTFLAMTLAKD